MAAHDTLVAQDLQLTSSESSRDLSEREGGELMDDSVIDAAAAALSRPSSQYSVCAVNACAAYISFCYLNELSKSAFLNSLTWLLITRMTASTHDLKALPSQMSTTVVTTMPMTGQLSGSVLNFSLEVMKKIGTLESKISL